MPSPSRITVISSRVVGDERSGRARRARRCRSARSDRAPAAPWTVTPRRSESIPSDSRCPPSCDVGAKLRSERRGEPRSVPASTTPGGRRASGRRRRSARDRSSGRRGGVPCRGRRGTRPRRRSRREPVGERRGRARSGRRRRACSGMPSRVVVDGVLALPGEGRAGRRAPAGACCGPRVARDQRHVGACAAPERSDELVQPGALGRRELAPAARSSAALPCARSACARRPAAGVHLYGRRARVDVYGRPRSGGHRLQRRLGGQVADGHAGVRRRPGRRRHRGREAPGVARRVGHVQADQVGAGGRGPAVDQPVPGRLCAAPRRQEALHQTRAARGGRSGRSGRCRCGPRCPRIGSSTGVRPSGISDGETLVTTGCGGTVGP